MLNYKTFILIFAIPVLCSCVDEVSDLRETQPDIPANLSSAEALNELGRVLFYDRKLSVNNSTSCSSCHKQELAFSDDRQFSMGFDNRPTLRNSLPIQNLGNFSGFFTNRESNSQFFGGFANQGLFWDGRIFDLNEMVLLPIVNHVEMGVGDLQKLSEKLSKYTYYRDLFSASFEEDSITTEKISQALVTFLRSIGTNNTKFDRYLRNEVQLNAQELMGKALFENTYQCNACHNVQTPNGYLFTGGFSNIGLESNYQDIGRQSVTKRPEDHGVFKISSLRNIAVTKPYMHDGRFSTLDEVLDHYSNGIQSNSGLDARLKDPNGNPLVFNISQADKDAIKAFLGTLTDWSMLTDPKFSDPFK